jgi:hypothetical protein
MRKFAGISAIASVQANLVKVQSSNIKISHTIIKLVKEFNPSTYSVTLDFDPEEQRMYLILVKPTDVGTEWAELNNAKILHPKYYTLNNSAIANFLGGKGTELNVDGEIESDENFIFIPLKTVVEGSQQQVEETETQVVEEESTENEVVQEEVLVGPKIGL